MVSYTTRITGSLVEIQRKAIPAQQEILATAPTPHPPPPSTQAWFTREREGQTERGEREWRRERESQG